MVQRLCRAVSRILLHARERDILLSPLVLTADLVFLLGSEVVLDVEGLPDLLGRLALDHVCNSLAANVEKSFDIEVVCSLGQLV
jgi:hypothetical protein